MIIVQAIDALREELKSWRRAGETIAFVPTMGNLHAGHIALVKRAQELGSKVVVSIFVNPTQFDRKEDLAAYPRTLAEDCSKLQAGGADLVFTPTSVLMYPTGGLATKVDVPGISALLEGASRPGHFTGVSTVVCKLFHLVQPDVAVFGEKDFQQLMLIRQMVRDLDMDIHIEGLPTVREADGLALSSRNGYLTTAERKLAAGLQLTLREVVDALHKGRQDYASLQVEAMQSLASRSFQPDYVEIRRAVDLLPAQAGDDDLVVLGSAWLGKARLIDNIALTLKKLTETS
ncbi:pantoate--beta-alanine ligase [Thiothrix fructosivorans]|uniref:Pantothenate synthetase n=1 Tax=Thiothrix fructosivorans TaxID=111770 RepID=A0A8B0SHN8_9GAMM|nr:pantoate--beta-alanine ligase [Thiothrix fructosivorans]MBO0611821.1 pantoate--beta-alanine ligase [Thiothrix fructosivorans]QTX10524.1 pantoate--beta-alanine ligase [Thiothrix fructosivorans]